MHLFKKIAFLLRIPQWSKAIFVFLGVIYSRTPGFGWQAASAALAFCVVASAVYIYNDMQDVKEDQAHPQKSNRPLACGAVSAAFALRAMLICLLIGLLLGFLVSSKLFGILAVYLIINYFYNHGLRDIPFLDVLCVASGFMLRILAGTIGIGLPITGWLTVTATSLSLFIALSKRRLEMHTGLQYSKRAVLKRYNPQMLNLLMIITATGCFLSYLLYTVYARDELLYFLLTLPFCALGLLRFTYLTIRGVERDDPVALVLHDNLSRINLLCFSMLTIMALLQ